MKNSSPSTHTFFPPQINTSLIIFIDMQERLLRAMPETIKDTIMRQKILLESAKRLQVPVVVTEQYPEGLGRTIAELSDIFDHSWPLLEKTAFSSLGTAQIRMELKKRSIDTIILAGVETHVCVLQTAIDALEKGFQTVILKDAVNSRKNIDMKTGFETARAAGAHLMTVESLIFMFMKDSKHPAFRDVSRLMK